MPYYVCAEYYAWTEYGPSREKEKKKKIMMKKSLCVLLLYMASGDRTVSHDYRHLTPLYPVTPLQDHDRPRIAIGRLTWIP